MKGSVAAFDLDGTLLVNNSSLAFCRYLYEKGFFSLGKLLYCSTAYLRYIFFSQNRQQNLIEHSALLRLHNSVFERLFKGRYQEELSPYLSTFLRERLSSFWYPPALFRLHALKNSGFKILLLSSSPIFLVREIAIQLGIDEVLATSYILDSDGKLLEIENLVDGKQKAHFMDRFHGMHTSAYTDSYLDLPFLEAVKAPVAVRPQYKLKKIAKVREWEIL